MEILLENLIILIILISFITSIFKNKQKKRSSPAPVEKKPEQKNSSAFEEMKEIFKEVNRTFQEDTKPPQRKLTKVYQDKINQTKGLVDHVTSQRDDRVNSYRPNETDVPQRVPISAPQNHLSVDRSNLVDAVIWAEILGPPRAKNPYPKNKVQRK